MSASLSSFIQRNPNDVLYKYSKLPRVNLVIPFDENIVPTKIIFSIIVLKVFAKDISNTETSSNT